MSGYNEVSIDEKVVERLKRKIIIQENRNLKTRDLNDQKMVKWIQNSIEEEVKCSWNQ